jgi:anti-sigma B factor antagonist
MTGSDLRRPDARQSETASLAPMASHPGFDVEVTEGDATTIVRATGEVDLATSPQLREALDRTIASGTPIVRLDMTGVTFLDSSGISVLVDAQQRLQEVSGQLVLHGVGDHIKRVLEISGLGSFFEQSDQSAS